MCVLLGEDIFAWLPKIEYYGNGNCLVCLNNKHKSFMMSANLNTII